jgi:hypothetical protein
MMLVPTVLSLSVTTVATCLSINTQEEVVKAAMACLAVLGLVATLFFAPWIVKLIVMIVPFALEKLNIWSQ